MKAESVTPPDQSPTDLDNSIVGADVRSSFKPTALSLIAITFCGIIFALLFVEILFRTITYFSITQKQVFDRPQRYVMGRHQAEKPNLNDDLPKPPGTFRILAVGDSFTFGQGIQRYDAYPARLETMLNFSESPNKAEVINWGVKGYSTFQEAELVRKGLAHLNPDAIILQITLNDPEMVPYRVTHKYLDKYGHVALTNPIFKYWKSLRFVVERVINSQSQKEYTKYYFDLFNNPETWDRFVGALNTIKRDADEKNVPLLAVVFPLFTHPLDASYPFADLHTKIDQQLTLLNIPTEDLLNDFAGMNPTRLQVMPGVDSHPNEIAQRIAAESIYRMLRKIPFVPSTFLTARTVAER